jgi:hypothetical protein
MGKMTSQQASQKKELGHAEERTFNAFFGNKNQRDVNYSNPSSDNEVTNRQYQEELTSKLGKLKSFNVSLKSGVTWQFHLGRIDELSPLSKIKVIKTSKGETKLIHSISFLKQQSILSNSSFWLKYLGKGDLLCYNDKKKKYTFFRMDKVIQFICEKVEWRILDTGRIKGDLLLNKKRRSILTFEYRDTKNQFAIGAMGGKSGLLLFEILRSNLAFCEIEFKSSVGNSEFIEIPRNIFNQGLNGKIGYTFFDSNYLYICVEKNKWKRIKLENV